MKKFAFASALALAGLLSASAGHAMQTGQTGNALLANCTEALRDISYDTAAIYYCHGVVRGTASTLDRWTQVEAKPSFCMPDGVTVNQIIRILVPYMAARPAHLHNEQEWFIFWALMEAFPCQPTAR